MISKRLVLNKWSQVVAVLLNICKKNYSSNTKELYYQILNFLANSEKVNRCLLVFIENMCLLFQGDSTSFGHTTISNLPADAEVLWVHIVIAVLFIPLGKQVFKENVRVIKELIVFKSWILVNFKKKIAILIKIYIPTVNRNIKYRKKTKIILIGL